MITPKLSKHSRKQDKESSSETQSSSSEEEEGDEEDTFHKSATITKKMEMWQKTVKKVDSDMLIEFHQSQPVNTVTLQALYTSIS